MNEENKDIINRFLLMGDKFEMHLKNAFMGS